MMAIIKEKKKQSGQSSKYLKHSWAPATHACNPSYS
jgi:hypothetical protein